ncbi:hypothetical protein NLI96_g3167 [Meripilus lineatus]|uniref:Uncharacterized protein n=1 Tax=Meripilus lineatus TaxID=2056292 RepID=A0AAD5V9E2_9APHY|nr:hypothetical protein NLI96_g3167 [Physisporinus lineatus]
MRWYNGRVMVALTDTGSTGRSDSRYQGADACLLTQYHGQDIQDVPKVWGSPRVSRGVIHGGILSSSGEWGRNIVVDPKPGGYDVFIIDFEDARMHESCQGAPLAYALGPEKRGDACEELFKFGLSAGLYAPSRSWEELHKTRYVDMVPPRRGPNAQTDKIAQEAWEEYMNNYGHLPSVCQVIQTLKEAAESGDATEDIQ